MKRRAEYHAIAAAFRRDPCHTGINALDLFQSNVETGLEYAGTGAGDNEAAGVSGNLLQDGIIFACFDRLFDF